MSEPFRIRESCLIAELFASPFVHRVAEAFAVCETFRMSEQLGIGDWIFLPPDFTGTVASPVMISGGGVLAYPVRHISEYVDGKCTASYDVPMRRRWWR